jgi:hypothetical protein
MQNHESNGVLVGSNFPPGGGACATMLSPQNKKPTAMIARAEVTTIFREASFLSIVVFISVV